MQLFANNAYSVLSDGIDGVTTIIEVSSGASFPNPTGGDHFLATLIGLDVNLNETSWEIVKVTARTGNVLTVVRGQDGTAAQAWPSATRVELRVSAENLTTLRAEGGAAAPVQSVASKTGAVTLVKDDVGLGNVDNTSDAAKPVSTATQTALNEKQATLVSGTNIKTVNSTTLVGSGNLDVGDVTLVGTQTLTNKTLTGAKETRVAMGANDIDLAAANFFTKTISAITTLTVSNVPATGTAASFVLELTNGGAFAITWWAGVKWKGGVAPSLTAAGVDILGFYTTDGGTTWRGFELSKDSK